jgi:hypothetical protein
VLVERVTVDVHAASAQVDVTSPWAGGMTSVPRLRRPVARYDQLSNAAALVMRIDSRRQAGHRCAPIAAHLNREGFYPPQRTERFTGETVARLLSRRGLHGPRPRAMSAPSVLRPQEYWLADFAREIPRPIATFHKWPRLGWVHSRQVPVASGRWAIWADADELERLRQLRAYQRKWPEPRYPQALTTPKRRELEPPPGSVGHDLENKEQSET